MEAEYFIELGTKPSLKQCIPMILNTTVNIHSKQAQECLAHPKKYNQTGNWWSVGLHRLHPALLFRV